MIYVVQKRLDTKSVFLANSVSLVSRPGTLSSQQRA